MTSIKAKIKNEIHVEDYIREFNNVKRFAYNRFCDKKTLSEVYHLATKTLNNCDLLDASFRESAVFKAKEVYDTSGEGVIFGKRSEFNKLKYHKEGAEELKKNVYFYSQGRKDFKGNRKFNFDLNNNKVIFKPKNGIKIEIEFENVSKNQRELLNKAQILSQQKLLPITVSVSQEYIIFSIDESIIKEPKEVKIIKNRILAFDSNPEFIGLTITDHKDADTKHVIHHEVIDLRKLSDCSTNKRTHEIYSVAQRIAKTAKQYKCELVAYENLTIKPKDHKKGKDFNRKVNNIWNRTKFFQNLNKWCNIFGIKTQEIECAYSSFIGQLMNETDPDMIAASKEISRRAFLFYNVYVTKEISLVDETGKKVDIIYPRFDLNILPTRWKKMVECDDKLSNWKKLFSHLKKSKLSYRFSFYDWKQSKPFFRHKSRKSNVFLYLC